MGVPKYIALRDSLHKCLENGLKGGHEEQTMKGMKEIRDGFHGISEQDFKLAVELCVSRLLQREMDENLKKPSPNVENVENCIKLSIRLCDAGFALPSCPFQLLCDIFENQKLDVCRKVFGFVETSVEKLTSPVYYSSGKNFLLLMCNNLLRRLSKSQDTVFCGRIRIFLASVFPLSEKSGLNLKSAFNVDNVTVFEKWETDEDQNQDGWDDQAGPVDYSFFNKFWGLQKYFNKPTLCYEPSEWAIFTDSAAAVIKTFQSHKLDLLEKDEKTGKVESNTSGDTEVYFSKYLTNKKLMNLQLDDGIFRQQILLQFLIVFQYLVGIVKFKAPSYVLTKDQESWLQETTTAVYELLKETPPNGKAFCKCVKHVLSRENKWIQWKNEGCPEFERKFDGSELKLKKKRKMDGELSGTGKYSMGNAELTRLWNLESDKIEYLKSEDRLHMPSIEEYFEEAIEQMDPEAMIEEEYKVVNDKVFVWRGLRLIAKSKLHYFQNFSNGKLETALTKIKADIDKATAKSDCDKMDEDGNNSELPDEEMEDTESKVNMSGNNSPSLAENTDTQMERTPEQEQEHDEGDSTKTR
eukprot:Nk52_evm11s349 gene=Nk52_evmTU11s349